MSSVADDGSRWQPLFEHPPVERLVYQHQAMSYQAIAQRSCGQSASYIVVIPGVIRDALEDSLTAQAILQAGLQVNSSCGFDKLITQHVSLGTCLMHMRHGSFALVDRFLLPVRRLHANSAWQALVCLPLISHAP